MEFFLKGSLPQGQTSKNWPVTLFTNRYCSIWLYDNENPELNTFRVLFQIPWNTKRFLINFPVGFC